MINEVFGAHASLSGAYTRNIVATNIKMSQKFMKRKLTPKPDFTISTILQ